MIAFAAWLLLMGGVVATGWGIFAALERPGWARWLGAAVAPLGILLALLGALLLFVPRFFG